MGYFRILSRNSAISQFTKLYNTRPIHLSTSKYLNIQLNSKRILSKRDNVIKHGILASRFRFYCSDKEDQTNVQGESKKVFLSSNDESDESSRSDDDEACSFERLRVGQNVKDLLEEAQTKYTDDEFNFDMSPEDEIAVAKKRAHVDPREMTVFLFPGQGTQVVGMGKTLLSAPHVNEMFEMASEILGYNLLSLCLNGPQDDLNQTIHCQPAVVITSLAAVQKIKDENPKIVENCVATAGFSVGEYAALVFSGSLTFQEAVYLIKVRAEAMQRASDCVESGMLSVIGHGEVNYKKACREAVEHCMNEGIDVPVCSVANYMFPSARVIAGHTKALDFLQDNMKRFGIRSTKRIAVSGAFHTDLMKPAQEPLDQALSQVNFDIPAISVHSNVDGKKYRHARHIRKQLKRQIVEPVKWEQTMHEIYQRKHGDGFPMTVEVGPGSQLGMMLKRINMKAARTYRNIDV